MADGVGDVDGIAAGSFGDLIDCEPQLHEQVVTIALRPERVQAGPILLVMRLQLAELYLFDAHRETS